MAQLQYRVAQCWGGCLSDLSVLLVVCEVEHASNVLSGTGGRRVSAVSEEVNERVGHPGLLGCCDDRLQVCDVTVHPAIADQSQHVEAATTLLGAFQRRLQHLVAVETAVCQ